MPDLSNASTRRVCRGTDRLDFSHFDMSHVEPFNVGLNFGSWTVA